MPGVRGVRYERAVFSLPPLLGVAADAAADAEVAVAAEAVAAEAAGLRLNMCDSGFPRVVAVLDLLLAPTTGELGAHCGCRTASIVYVT